MKKFILIGLLFTLAVLFSINVKAQPDVTVGLTINKFNVDTKSASNIGGGITLSVKKIYLDCSGNFASGKGEYLNYQSNKTYKLNKISAVVVNLGYIINLEKFAFIPVIGYGSKGDIYEDPVGWNTYFIDRKAHINLGLIGRIIVDKNIIIQLGFSSFEGAKFGISYASFF